MSSGKARQKKSNDKQSFDSFGYPTAQPCVLVGSFLALPSRITTDALGMWIDSAKTTRDPNEWTSQTVENRSSRSYIIYSVSMSENECL